MSSPVVERQSLQEEVEASSDATAAATAADGNDSHGGGSGSTTPRSGGGGSNDGSASGGGGGSATAHHHAVAIPPILLSAPPRGGGTAQPSLTLLPSAADANSQAWMPASPVSSPRPAVPHLRLSELASGASYTSTKDAVVQPRLFFAYSFLMVSMTNPSRHAVCVCDGVCV